MKGIILLILVAVALAKHRCGENAHFESCGTSCPLTCENYSNPPEFCILKCDIGCHCDRGFVKTSDELCVKPDECFASGTYRNWNTMKTVILISILALAVAAYEPEIQTCLEEPDEGLCRAYIPMFHYDYKSRSCKEFIYGGCGGNGNRYATEEDCMSKCGDVVVFESDSDVCELPPATGPCYALFRKFYFDKATGQCKRFVYGGCGGNGNRFNSLEECQNRCGVKASASSVCELEKVTGPCRGGFRRYFFNKETGKCERFIYGGCLGNENNFKTIEDCEDVCSD